MSERTFESRLARLRASRIWDFRRESSRRCSWRISRCRERLFCFRAEAVASESRRRESCDMRVSLWMGINIWYRILGRPSVPFLMSLVFLTPSGFHLL